MYPCPSLANANIFTLKQFFKKKLKDVADDPSLVLFLSRSELSREINMYPYHIIILHYVHIHKQCDTMHILLPLIFATKHHALSVCIPIHGNRFFSCLKYVYEYTTKSSSNV